MPITPEVLRLNELYRAALLANERQAAASMVRFYGVGWQKLQADITKLSVEIARKRLAGEAVTRGSLVRLERMRAINAQVEQELARFAKYADTTISAQMRTAIAAAERQSYQLIRASYPGQLATDIPITFYRLPSESVESLVGFLEDGTPLGNLIQQYVGEAAADFSETLVTGLIAGQGPRETAR